MGEFSGIETIQQNIEVEKQSEKISDKCDYDTGVNGIKSNGIKNGLPVFRVSDKEFFDNMKSDRRRSRFKSGSNVSNFMKSTKYGKSFYIQNSDSKFLRKIK